MENQYISSLIWIIFELMIMAIPFYHWEKSRWLRNTSVFILSGSALLLVDFIFLKVFPSFPDISSNVYLYKFIYNVFKLPVLVICTVYIHYLNHTSYALSLFIYFLTQIYTIFANTASTWAYNMLSHHPMDELSSTWIFIIRIVIILMLITFTRLYLSKHHRMRSEDPFTICLFAGIMTMFIDGISQNTSFSSIFRIEDMFVLSGMLVVPIALLLMLNKLNEIQEEKIMHENTVKALKLSRQQLSILNDKDIEVIKVKHDIISHLRMIQTFMNNDNYEAADLYLQKTCGLLSNKQSLKTYSQNTYINAVINYKTKAEKDIVFDIVSEIGNENKIDPLDLGILVMNLLDQRISYINKFNLKQEIYLKISQRENMVSLLIDSQLPDEEDKNPYDMYEGNIINHIVDKYKGTLQRKIHTETDCGILLNG
jgi:non-homologous end joining protein Ku